jgi:hypothetical protein
MSKIIWIGPDRLIPPYGAATKGQELDLPDNIADSYVSQKLAKFAGGEKVTKRILESKAEIEDS